MSTIRIRTHKIKATDTTGEGVRAEVTLDGTLTRTARSAWDYGMSAEEMHRSVAQKAMQGVSLTQTGYTRTGYIFRPVDGE